jgi:hypothetical protein
MELETKLLALIIMLALAAGTSLAAYEYGKHVQKVNDTNAGLSQQVTKGKIERTQDDTTSQVAEAYTATIDNLNAKFAWLRKHPTIVKVAVPGTPTSPKSSDAAVQEFGRTCTSAFYQNALDDVVKLNAWQEWAKDQHIPVK